MPTVEEFEQIKRERDDALSEIQTIRDIVNEGLEGVPGKNFAERVKYLRDHWLDGSRDPEAIYSRAISQYLYRYAYCVEMESNRLMAFEIALECEAASDSARLRILENVVKDVRRMAARLHNMKAMI